MPATFDIVCDPDRDLIRIRSAGFYDAEDISRFLTARNVAHARLRCRRNRHVTLHDVREMKIQSQEIVGQFHAVLADPLYRSRRLAFVVASSLARMQLLRALGERTAGLFFDETAALRWLLSEEPVPAVVNAA